MFVGKVIFLGVVEGISQKTGNQDRLLSVLVGLDSVKLSLKADVPSNLKQGSEISIVADLNSYGNLVVIGFN